MAGLGPIRIIVSILWEGLGVMGRILSPLVSRRGRLSTVRRMAGFLSDPLKSKERNGVLVILAQFLTTDFSDEVWRNGSFFY